MLNFPVLLEKCGDSKHADAFTHEVPEICIKDLNKAAKLLVKIMGETDNEVKFALDLAMLERMFKVKLQKHCPFLEEVTLEDIRAGGECLESAYQLSRIFEAAFNDMRAGNKPKAMDEFSQGFALIPDTLTDCGQTQWADKMRKAFPVQCVNSLEDFAGKASEFLHNYDRVEWLYTHLPEIYKSMGEVKKNCPEFK